MASLLRFAISPVELQNIIQAKQDQSESSRRLHFVAARKIQTWFRAVVTRAHLRRLHEHATILQRHWRGYRTRLLYRRYLIEYVHRMWQDYYESMATRIQAVWRGYWTRKTRVNFVQLRRWLRAVYAKNDQVLEDMKKYRQAELEHTERRNERKSLLRILFILFKLHHLLRTECRPGVITRIDQTRFTYIEGMLRCLQYEHYIPRAKSPSRDRKVVRDLTPSIFRDAHLGKCQTKMRQFERNLQIENVPVFESAVDHLLEGDSRAIVENKCLEEFSHDRNLTPVELYEAIDRMDCRLNHLHLKCPIHGLIL